MYLFVYFKGSGTVVVRLKDVNDNSPRLSRREWHVQVFESSNFTPMNNDTLLEISVSDADVSNYFSYRVSEFFFYLSGFILRNIADWLKGILIY